MIEISGTNTRRGGYNVSQERSYSASQNEEHEWESDEDDGSDEDKESTNVHTDESAEDVD